MRTSDWAYPAFLAFCLLAVFIGCKDNQFTLDAELIIRDNALVQESDFSGIFGADYWNRTDGDTARSLYRPVTISYYALCRLISAEPSVVNLGNVILHILNALLRFALLLFLFRSLKHRRLMAFAICLLAGVHGVISEGVFGMVGAAEILTSIFMALSWWAFAVALECGQPGRKWGLLALSAAAWLMGLLSKETAAAFPLVLLVYGFLTSGGNSRRNVASTLLSVVPHIAALGIWALSRIEVLGAFAPFGDKHVYVEFTTLERILSSLAVMGSCYVPAMLWPFDMLPTITHQDVAPPSGFGELPVLLGLAAWCGVIGWTGWAIIRRYALSACFGLMFLLTLLPVSNLFVPIGALGAYRFLYTPFFALAAGLVLLTGRLLEARPGVGRALLALGLWLVVIGAVGSASLSGKWKDSKTLYSYSYKCNPASLWALKNHSFSSYLTDNTKKHEDRIAILDQFSDIREGLHVIPSTGELDPMSRLLAARICMNRVGFFLQSGMVSVQNIEDPLRSAARAEAYSRGVPSLMFQSRMIAGQLMLHRVQLLLQDSAAPDEDKNLAFDMAEDQFARIGEAVDESISDIQQANYHHQLFKLLTLRSRTLLDEAQSAAKKADALRHLGRALELDPANSEIRIFNAQQHIKARRFKAALAELKTVMVAERADVAVYKMAADIARQLRDPVAYREYLTQCLSRPATSPAAFELQKQARQELMSFR